MASLFSDTWVSCQVPCLDDALSSLGKSLLTAWQRARLAVVPPTLASLRFYSPMKLFGPEPIWQSYSKILGFQKLHDMVNICCPNY